MSNYYDEYDQWGEPPPERYPPERYPQPGGFHPQGPPYQQPPEPSYPAPEPTYPAPAWGQPPRSAPRPANPRRLSGLAWGLAGGALVMGVLVGAMLGAVGGGEPAAPATAAEPIPATPGTCLQALDLAETGQAGDGTWNHLATDCRSKAAADPAAGSGQPATTAAPEAAGEAAEPPAPAAEPAEAAEPAAGEPAAVAEPSGIPDGVHVVGSDIEPGTYQTAGPADSLIPNCYWERLSGLGGEFGDIIAHDNLQGPGAVAIAESDAAFKSQGCQPWEKVG